MHSKNLLEYLTGEQLSSVEFVQDYLQLHFEDITLTCYIWPFVVSGNLQYEKGHLEYRNKLCEGIGKIVDKVNLIEKVSLEIELSDYYKIILSLDPRNPEIIAEIAILSDNENNWSVFD
jgi:hypothetical protein